MDEPGELINQRALDDIVKQEEDNIKNPNIEWTLMRMLRLEDEAIKYMEQKYYNQSISGLIGKIFDMKQDINEKDIDMKPGFARCRYCHQQFSRWRTRST
jgi:hypothetical protein